MDQAKKFTTNELIILGGSVLVFIGTFLKWFKVDLGGLGDGGVSGFHYFLQGTIPWIITVAVAASLIIRKLVPTVNLPELPIPWAQAYLIACGIVAFLILTRIISVDGPSQIVDRGIGLFMAFLGGIAMVVGAFLKFQAKEADDAGTGTGTGTAPPTPF